MTCAVLRVMKKKAKTKLILFFKNRTRDIIKRKRDEKHLAD